MPLASKDLRELSTAELDKKLRDLRAARLKTRLSKQTGQLEKSHLLNEQRRDIARLLTIIRQKSSTRA